MSAVRRLSASGKAAALVLAAMGLLVVVGPLLLPAFYSLPSPLTYAAPNAVHPCGTDLNGRDLLLRILEGGRISLLVGLCGAAISLFIGTAYGLVAGSSVAGTDNAMMRVVDILYSVPRLIFILVFINAFNERLQFAASHHGWDWLVGSSRLVILILSPGHH